jgi:hypothetical protein
LLSPHSRDVWNLTSIGDVDRLRKVVTAEPRLAKVSWQTTPLFWLPEDEQKAHEIVKLFLEHGADPNFRSIKDGWTAADVARKRGMRQVAELLDAAGGVGADPDKARREHLLTVYEQLAHDLVTVFESDDTEALERLGRHYNRIVSFEDVRSNLRRGADRVRLELDDARELIAKNGGFKNWASFLESIGACAPVSPP